MIFSRPLPPSFNAASQHEVVVASRFKLRISAILCKNSSDLFLDTKGCALSSIASVRPRDATARAEPFFPLAVRKSIAESHAASR